MRPDQLTREGDPSASPEDRTAEVSVRRVGAGAADVSDELDPVGVEEPLEIRLAFGSEEKRQQRSISVTMRTPGDDFDLAAGFLFAEGIVSRSEDVLSMGYCGKVAPGRATTNVVRVELHPTAEVPLKRLERNFVSNSSCGLCGKASLEAVGMIGSPIPPDVGPKLNVEVIHGLPGKLRAAQPLFAATGGVHGAALFDASGELKGVREDIGRHNAVDKLVGSRLRAGETPLRDSVLLVSGRTSFEILQKTLVAEIPVLVAVGAPSSLAVDLAEEFGITLIGFATEKRYNVYTHPQRVLFDS